MVQDQLGAGLFDNVQYLGSISGTHNAAGISQVGSSLVLPVGTFQTGDEIYFSVSGLSLEGGSFDIRITVGATTLGMIANGQSITGVDYIGATGSIRENTTSTSLLDLIMNGFDSGSGGSAYGYILGGTLSSSWITQQITLKIFCGGNPLDTAYYTVKFWRIRGRSP